MVSSLIELWYRVTATFRRRRLERDLDDEVAFHLAMRHADTVAGGVLPSDAKREARRRFGNVTVLKEQMREMRTFPSLDSIRQDVWYAVRSLRRQPGVSAVIVGVLGIVIGLNTTLFTVVAGIALRPWPGVTDPSRLVRVYLQDPSGLAAGFSRSDYLTLAEQATSLSGIAGSSGASVRVGPASGTTATDALMVSENFFDLLGVTFADGRGFVSDDDDALAVLGYDFWRTRLGGEAGVVGRTITINDVPFRVVGIASQAFGRAEPAYRRGLFLPFATLPLLHPSDPSDTNAPTASVCCVDVVGRLAPGTTRAMAANELDVLSRQFVAFSGNKARGVAVVGTEFVAQPGRGDSAQALLPASLLMSALLLVWLIACANVGNLLLARAAARVREIGVRLSLGATRGRLVRQLLTEGFVLALAAGAIGIGVADQLPTILFRIVAEPGTQAAFPFSVEPDGVVLGYAVILAGLSTMAFALAPALWATRASVASALGQRDGLTASRFPLRGLLLAIQVAVSVVLLVSAGLLVRAAQRQGGTFDPGFSVDEVAVVSFDLPEGVYDRPRATAYFADLTAGLRGLPIDGFAFASREPFSLYREGTFFHLPGETKEQARTLSYLDVSPEYMRLLRIPILAGRDFDAADVGRPGVLINESMARRYWPGERPVGKTLFMRPRGPSNDMVAREVVGVVRNVQTGMSDKVQPMLYVPALPGTTVRDFISVDPRASQAPTLLVKTTSTAVLGDIARRAAQLDSRVQARAVPLSVARDTMLASARWGTILAGTLGAFALVLATIGMFGVFAYAVRQQTREIGIRMALGAPAAAVVRLVLAGHSKAVLAGLGVGLLGSVAASIVLRSRLHGLSPFDPSAYLGVAAILAVAGLLASVVPARRATRVDPLEALRCD